MPRGAAAATTADVGAGGACRARAAARSNRPRRRRRGGEELGAARAAGLGGVEHDGVLANHLHARRRLGAAHGVAVAVDVGVARRRRRRRKRRRRRLAGEALRDRRAQLVVLRRHRVVGGLGGRRRRHRPRLARADLQRVRRHLERHRRVAVRVRAELRCAAPAEQALAQLVEVAHHLGVGRLQLVVRRARASVSHRRRLRRRRRQRRRHVARAQLRRNLVAQRRELRLEGAHLGVGLGHCGGFCGAFLRH